MRVDTSLDEVLLVSVEAVAPVVLVDSLVAPIVLLLLLVSVDELGELIDVLLELGLVLELLLGVVLLTLALVSVDWLRVVSVVESEPDVLELLGVEVLEVSCVA